MKSRVCWAFRQDSTRHGHGERVPTYLAQIWVKYMNRECPEIRHWEES